MDNTLRINSTHAWLKALEELSAVVSNMKLDKKIKNNTSLDDLSLRLANSAEHKALIIRSVENLVATGAASQQTASELLVKIFGKSTVYGSFSELAVYDWIMRCNVKITAQVKMSAAYVLGNQPVDIDGQMDHFWDVCFEIKAFGFNGMRANRLRERLQDELSDLQVSVGGSWDLPNDLFKDLIEDAPSIARELREKRHLHRGALYISATEPRSVSITSVAHRPYALARENAAYAFLNANQFTRHKPFVLLYAIHPWFSQLMNDDFANAGSTFTRAFARRTFMQFQEDVLARNSCKQISDNTTLGEASRLLTAIMFVNIWPCDLYPAGSSEASAKPAWIYVNPRASHKLPDGEWHIFQTGHHVTIDDFSDDDY